MGFFDGFGDGPKYNRPSRADKRSLSDWGKKESPTSPYEQPLVAAIECEGGSKVVIRRHETGAGRTYAVFYQTQDALAFMRFPAYPNDNYLLCEVPSNTAKFGSKLSDAVRHFGDACLRFPFDQVCKVIREDIKKQQAMEGRG